MIIKNDLCTACGECVPTCPVGAIEFIEENEFCTINRDLCVECEVCLRSQVCDSGALEQEKLEWPRLVRSLFSNPVSTHKQTLVPGRGTEGMKTNDVSGRYGPDILGVYIELGRPGISTGFHDICKVAKVCAQQGARFEPLNPLTQLMADPSLGTIKPEIMDERVLSVLIEFEIERNKWIPLLKELESISTRIDTVFSLSLVQLCGPSEELTLLDEISRAGFSPSPNGKMNVGLGRPRFTLSGE